MLNSLYRGGQLILGLVLERLEFFQLAEGDSLDVRLGCFVMNLDCFGQQWIRWGQDCCRFAHFFSLCLFSTLDRGRRVCRCCHIQLQRRLRARYQVRCGPDLLHIATK